MEDEKGIVTIPPAHMMSSSIGTGLPWFTIRVRGREGMHAQRRIRLERADAARRRLGATDDRRGSFRARDRRERKALTIVARRRRRYEKRAIAGFERWKERVMRAYEDGSRLPPEQRHAIILHQSERVGYVGVYRRARPDEIAEAARINARFNALLEERG